MKLKTGIMSLLLVLCCVSFLSSTALAAKKKKSHTYKTVYYYVDEEMYLCAVTNTKSTTVFYGESPKMKYARMYAHAACIYRSYKGACWKKAKCDWAWVRVRKRKYVRA